MNNEQQVFPVTVTCSPQDFRNPYSNPVRRNLTNIWTVPPLFRFLSRSPEAAPDNGLAHPPAPAQDYHK